LLWIFSGMVFLPTIVMLANRKESSAAALGHRDEPVRIEEVSGERNPCNVRKTGTQ
jgi:hypothetical protein